MRQKEEEKEFLLIVSSYDPLAKKVVDRQGVEGLDNSFLNEINEILSDELIKKGLKSDDEPNSYGLEIEDYISFVSSFLN